MTTIAELEAALQQSFDRELLAVYADVLQATGDPRGELVAIDLHADEHGPTPELADRKRRLVDAWAGPGFNHRQFRYGFYDYYGRLYYDPTAETVAKLFDSPAAPYIRGLVINAERMEARMIAPLVEEPRPWLRRLMLSRFYTDTPSDVWREAFPRMTPNLDELAIVGRSPGSTQFQIDHPNVRRLVVEQNPLDLRGVFPRVVELDTDNPEDARALDDPRVLPAVHRIDLSRIHLRYFNLPPRIDHVRVRAPVTMTQVQRMKVQRARPIEIARAYEMHRQLLDVLADAPHVTISNVYPWPPFDQIFGERTHDILIADLEISLGGLVYEMEHCFDVLPPRAQAAWREVWACTSKRPIELGTIAFAFAALDDCRFGDGNWATIASTLYARAAVNPHELVDVTLKPTR